MQIGLRTGAAFVDHAALGVAVEPEVTRHRMRLVARYQMREAKARSRCRLEAAVAPAGI